MDKKWMLAFLIALANDAVDLGLTWIPLAGTMGDFVTGVVLFLLLKTPIVLLGVFELPVSIIPGVSGVNALPIWTGAVMLAYSQRGKK